MSKSERTNLFVEIEDFTNETFNSSIYEVDFKGENEITFSRCTFKDSVLFDDISVVGIYFFNCSFKSKVSILNSSFEILVFDDCTFEKKLIINNSICSSYIAVENAKAKYIEISGNYKLTHIIGSEIEDIKVLDINSSSTQRDSKIIFHQNRNVEKISVEPYLTFSSIIFNGGNYNNINFEGDFQNSLVFKGKIMNNMLSFESTSFSKRIDFQEGGFNHVYFYRSSFEGIIYINDYKSDDVIDSKDLSIDKLWIHSSNFENDFSIYLSSLRDVTLSNNNFKQHFNFSGNNESTLDDIVMISNDGSNRGTMIFEKAHVDISFRGINFGNIFIKECNVWTFNMDDINNQGVISLNNIREVTFFTIQDSISGELNFINTDVNKFREIVIANSNIEKVNFVDYPKRICSYSSDPRVGYGIEDRSKNRDNLKSIYNQLKQIAKRKGDIDASIKYQSLEYKQLLLSKTIISFDKLLLLLNWTSNNYGKSWFRGILFTFTISFSLFLLYINNLEVSHENINYFEDYVLFFTSFPKLQLERFSELNNSWNVSLIIWLSRIFISYGIYQTVAAFRKYGKR